MEGKKRIKDRSLNLARLWERNKRRREDAEKRCRIWYAAEENMSHVLNKECKETKSEMLMEEFIKVEDKGIEIMKRIDKARKKAEGREKKQE